MQVQYAASLMCMDLTNVRQDTEILNRHCHMLHADIMDGHFSPSFALTPLFVEAIRPLTRLPIDAHIMCERPGELIGPLAKAGADILSLHVETINVNAFRLMGQVRDAGCKVGLVLNPATSIEALALLLPLADIVTLMTVDIGYAGQRFIPQMLPKIRQAADLILEGGYDCLLQMDGACNRNTYKATYEAGIRAYVMGSSGLFGLSDNLEDACLGMKREFTNAVNGEQP